jgi:hypothetical protein
MANPQVPVSYEFTLTVNPVDIEGNPVADTLTWSNSDTTGATTLTVDDATTLVVTIAVPGPGTATGVVITATDADGVTGSYTFDAVADVASAFTLAAGTPTKIPAAA